MQEYRRLIAAVRPHKGLLAAAIGSMLVLSAATGAFSWLVGPMFQFVFKGGALDAGALKTALPFLREPANISRETVLRTLPLIILLIAAVLSVRPSWPSIAVMGGVVVAGLVVGRVPPGAAPRLPRWLWVGFLAGAALALVAGGRPDVAVGGLRVGVGTDPATRIGPLIDAPALAKVQRHVADAIDGGAQVLIGGGPHELGGTFFSPTVLDGVTLDMAIAREETFGPVAALHRFSDEDDVIRVANDTPYGLAAYFYSRDVGRVFRVSEQLEYGIVGINTGFISTEVAPFGGVKESGIGREGSKYGIDDWIETRYLSLGGIDR